MHYSSYPYPDVEFYLRDNRKISGYRVNTVPTKQTWDQWFPGNSYRSLRVLVVGCGTTEALMIAGTNPDHQVTGIDVSEESINIAKVHAAAEDIKNLILYHGDIMVSAFAQPFDVISASGILHHIRDVAPFLMRLRSLTTVDGRLSAMVYGNYVRSFIPGFCDAMTKLGLKADKEGVACTKAILNVLPENHSVKNFHDMVAKSDSNIADTWLHSYFRQYSASEFIHTVEQYDFSFKLWLSEDDIEAKVIEALPVEFNYLKDRFYRLSAADRWDICQVFNQHDLQLTALFAAR